MAEVAEFLGNSQSPIFQLSALSTVPCHLCAVTQVVSIGKQKLCNSKFQEVEVRMSCSPIYRIGLALGSRLSLELVFAGKFMNATGLGGLRNTGPYKKLSPT